jgi:hypothetical protein
LPNPAPQASSTSAVSSFSSYLSYPVPNHPPPVPPRNAIVSHRK